eukprot:SAG31_NODE_4260_length_3407_cov_3.743652_2_plen_468_part_00
MANLVEHVFPDSPWLLAIVADPKNWAALCGHFGTSPDRGLDEFQYELLNAKMQADAGEADVSTAKEYFTALLKWDSRRPKTGAKAGNVPTEACGGDTGADSGGDRDEVAGDDWPDVVDVRAARTQFHSNNRQQGRSRSSNSTISSFGDTSGSSSLGSTGDLTNTIASGLHAGGIESEDGSSDDDDDGTCAANLRLRRREVQTGMQWNHRLYKSDPVNLDAMYAKEGDNPSTTSTPSVHRTLEDRWANHVDHLWRISGRIKTLYKGQSQCVPWIVSAELAQAVLPAAGGSGGHRAIKEAARTEFCSAMLVVHGINKDTVAGSTTAVRKQSAPASAPGSPGNASDGVHVEAASSSSTKEATLDEVTQRTEKIMASSRERMDVATWGSLTANSKKPTGKFFEQIEAAQGEWKAIAEGLLSRAQPVPAQNSELSSSLVRRRNKQFRKLRRQIGRAGDLAAEAAADAAVGTN